MKIATFNVLADAYTGYGDYSHADPKLMAIGARLGHIISTINNLDADVIGLQEADNALVEAFKNDSSWQTLWTQKGRNKPDGCLTLVKDTLPIDDYSAHEYNDDSGHVFHILRIGQLAIANTHIKWAPATDIPHIGAGQAQQLLTALSNTQPAVILADCNDQPGGPVRQLVAEAGFTNVCDGMPTAIVNQQAVALDLLATRGVTAKYIPRTYNLATVPNVDCASDHIPIVASIWH